MSQIAVQSDYPEIDADQATAALSALFQGFEEFCFQVFDDSTPKRKYLAKTLYGTLQEHLATIETYQKKGAGVFVTVNHTDKSGNRENENITAINSLFADFDGCHLINYLSH